VPFNRDGVDPTDGVLASLDGDRFTNTGREIFVVANYSGGAIDVTFSPPGQVDGQDVEAPVIALQDGDVRLLGPWPPSIYGTTVRVSYSSNTSAYVQVLKF
jgi:hypothetical protein